MPADKYPSIFSRQMEAIAYIVPKVQRPTKLYSNFPSRQLFESCLCVCLPFINLGALKMT